MSQDEKGFQGSYLALKLTKGRSSTRTRLCVWQVTLRPKNGPGWDPPATSIKCPEDRHRV